MNLNKNRGLFVLAYGIATSIMGFTLYPLLDFLLCNFITNKKFEYNVADHIISPLVFGFVFAFVYSFGQVEKRK